MRKEDTTLFAITLIAVMSLGACDDEKTDVVTDSGTDGDTDSDTDADTDSDSDDPATALQALIDETAAREEIPSVLLRVVAPSFEFEGAGGTTELGGDDAVDSGDALVLHSVTKTFTAVAALLAVEDGLLGLDQPITEVLPGALTDGLHVLDEVDRSDEITIRQLLSHRSGLADYFFDGAQGDDWPPFVAGMLDDPDRLWDPVDLIEWTKENLEPVFAPGEGFHYADTNYVLVGLALEAVHGAPLHEIYAAQLFEPLGMEHTWMLFREDPRLPEGGALTHVYLEDIDLATMTAMSADWAGGGLVSTTRDLYVFLEATLSGEVFDDAASLEALRDYESDGYGGEYGLGIMRYVHGTVALEGHGGFGGAFMYRDADTGVFYLGTVNQAATEADFLGGVLGIVLAV